MRVWAVILAVVFAAGCSSYEVSQTGRRFTDQAVSTTSITKAVQSMEIPEKIRGKQVFVETVSAGAQDEKYLKRCLEVRLLASGVKLATDPKSADYILIVMVEMCGTDVSKSNIEFPVPLAWGEVILYASMEEKGYTRFRPYLMEAENQVNAEPLDFAIGQSKYKRIKMGVLNVTRTDIYKQEEGVGGLLKGVGFD